ncbi:type VI secretion system protein TssL, partial [Salmonella enterica subsp. enterica serovar Wilhelmsburg]
DARALPGHPPPRDAIRPATNQAARELARVGGAVTVTGHTDSQPIHSAEFPSNLVLSEKRAAEVAALLTSGGVPAGGVHIVGKGGRVPVAANGRTAGGAA